MRYVARGVFVASAMGLSAVVLCPAGAQAQVSTAYTYDALGRLKTVTNAGGATVTYAYDAAGNRSQVVVAGVQTAPSAFDLGAPVTGAAAGAWVLSASPVLSGFTGAAAISVTGGEYRIDGGSWQTAAATVSAGQSVQVRVQAPTTAGASQTATLNVGSVTAAFQVTTATADTTPDAISPADHSLTADVDESFTAGSSFTVSGITAPITLRFGSSLISTSGNVSSRQMIVVRTTAAGVREEWFVAAPAGTLDVTANNGDQFTIKGFLATSSGRASTSWRWTVSNQTAGGAQLGTATVTQTVDNDNNFNMADTTPDAISPADHSLTADVDESFTAGSSFTVSGITAPITLRFGSSLISTSGNVSSRQMIVVRTTAAGVREEWFVAAPAGTLDVTANNGDQFTIKGFLATSSGRASTSWRWTVSNQTAGGAQLGTATVTQTVDNDNNFNMADTTPDAISPADHSLTADVDESFTAGSSFTVSGITAPITLRFGSSLISTSGNVSSRQMIVVRTTAAGVREEWFVAAPAGTLDVTANNGDQFTIKGFLATSSGRASTSWRWTVSNQTAGGAQLGTATVTQTVDNDNNFKVD